MARLSMSKLRMNSLQEIVSRRLLIINALKIIFINCELKVRKIF